MHRSNESETSLQVVAGEKTGRSHRSWLPMQPHLLVPLDPIQWSQRARREQFWCREAERIGVHPRSAIR